MAHSAKNKMPKSVPTATQLQEQLNQIENALSGLKSIFDQINAEIGKMSSLIDTLKSGETVVTQKTPKSPPTKQRKTKKENKGEEKKAAAVEKTASKPTFLDLINTLPIPELEEKLKNANAKQNVINNIVNERKKLNFQQFSSLDDIITRIKGLAKPSLEKILEQWSS